MEKSPTHNDPESSRSSTNSDQEVDQPADYVAASRSYECVFCKRGFTTAQALGGHMNIHRKDRAKNRPVGPVPTSIHSNNHHHHQQINYHTTPINKIYSHHPVSGYVPPQYNYYSYDVAALREPQHDNYRTYFPASTSDGGSRIPQFGDDWRVNMSMQFGGLARGEGEEEEKGGDQEEDDDDEELDLELRLGYNP